MASEQENKILETFLNDVRELVSYCNSGLAPGLVAESVAFGMLALIDNDAIDLFTMNGVHINRGVEMHALFYKRGS